MAANLRGRLGVLNRGSSTLEDAARNNRPLESTLSELLKLVCEHVNLPDTLGTIVLRRGRGAGVGVEWSRRIGVVTGSMESLERGLIRVVYHAKQPILEQDLRRHRPAGYVDIASNIRCELAAPIFLGEHVVGVFSIASSKAGALGEEDKFWLEQLVTLLQFMFLSRVGLGAGHEEVAHEIARDLASGEDVDLVLDKILKNALEITKLNTAYAAILVLDGDRVVARRAYRVQDENFFPDRVEGAEVWSRSRGVTGRALRTGQVTVVNNVLVDPDYFVGPSEIRSETVIPITRGRDRVVIGALDVQTPIANAFDDSTTAELIALAEQIDLALYTAQLSETLKREQSVFERLAGVAPSVIQSLDPRFVYHLILEATLSLLPTASSSQILTVKTDQKTGQQSLMIEQALNRGNDPGEDWRTNSRMHQHDINKGITGESATTRRTLYVSDVRTRADYIEFSKLTHSELAIPLALGGVVLGVLNIESQEVDGFSRRDQQVAELIAAEAVFTISNAENYTRTIRLLNAVADATRRIVGTVEDVDSLVGSILEGAMSVTDTEDGYCALILIEDGKLKIKREESANLLPGRLMEWSLDEGLTGRAIRTGKPINVPDVYQDKSYIAATPTTRSNLVVPLLNQQQEAVGALSLESPRVNAFDEHAIKALERFGPPVVAALEKSNLVQSLQQRQQEMVDLMKQLAHLLRTPVETLRESLHESAEQSRLTEEPLSRPVQDSEPAAEFLSLMLEWLDAQADVLGQSYAQHQRRRFDVRELVAQTVRAYRYYVNRKSMTLLDPSPSEPVIVEADREELLGALVEVLANAVKYNRPEGRIIVSVDRVLRDVQIAVEDEGSGVPAVDRERIFKRAVRGGNVSGVKGTGLGLYFVRAALQRQSGGAYVESRAPEPGSRFILSLPSGE